MVIKTEYGDFGSFKDIETFMRLEDRLHIHIESAVYWGIECILSKEGITLSR